MVGSLPMLRQRAREEAPVRIPPVLERTVTLSFFVGEPGIDFVVGPYLDLGSLDDA